MKQCNKVLTKSPVCCLPNDMNLKKVANGRDATSTQVEVVLTHTVMTCRAEKEISGSNAK